MNSIIELAAISGSKYIVIGGNMRMKPEKVYACYNKDKDVPKRIGGVYYGNLVTLSKKTEKYTSSSKK